MSLLRPVAAAGPALPGGLTVDMAVVFAVVVAAAVLFVTEWLPVDVTAIAIMVALVVLEP